MTDEELIEENIDPTQDLYDEIDRGKLGLNKGIPMGFPFLDSVTNGLQKARYDLLFGLEKSGKSAFLNSAYILNPYDYLLKKGQTEDLMVLYFSLEMSAKMVKAKWLADIIFREEGILVDTNIILKKGDHDTPDYLYPIFNKYRAYLKKMLETSVKIIAPEALNPTGIYRIVYDYALKNGKFVGKTYVANNPNQIVVVITDTAGNLKWERVEGVANMKVTIDKMSHYNRYFRNTLEYLPVMIMHANRNLSDFKRESEGDIYPKTSDIAESGQVSKDINLSMCIFDPTPYLDRTNIDLKQVVGGYDITKIKKRFRSVAILSSRDGECFIRKGMVFIGEIGRFYELPPPQNTEELNKWYNRVNEIKKLDVKTK